MASSVLKGLTIAAFIWVLFLLNLFLPRFVNAGSVSFNSSVWALTLKILFGIALFATIVVITESIRRRRPRI
jgi:hypothetical protein